MCVRLLSVVRESTVKCVMTLISATAAIRQENVRILMKSAMMWRDTHKLSVSY